MGRHRLVVQQQLSAVRVQPAVKVLHRDRNQDRQSCPPALQVLQIAEHRRLLTAKFDLLGDDRACVSGGIERDRGNL